MQKHRGRKAQACLEIGEEMCPATHVDLFGEGTLAHDPNRGIHCLHFPFCFQG